MKREEYLKYRKDYATNIMYEFYKEKFDAEKHSPFLTLDQFHEYIQLWPLANIAVNDVLAYYDAKFNIMRIPDKLGNIIRYE